MKNLYLLITIVSLCSFSCITSNADKKDKDKEFLIEMADARMMDAQEGRLAAERGTTSAIREYGSYMVKDQAILLQALQNVAASKNITLPKSISDEKSDALDKLKEKTGTDFDKKFTSMIKIDHKRDVRKFTKATKSEDTEISNFAKQYLPTIQQHLDGIQKIKDEM